MLTNWWTEKQNPKSLKSLLEMNSKQFKSKAEVKEFKCGLSVWVPGSRLKEKTRVFSAAGSESKHTEFWQAVWLFPMENSGQLKLSNKKGRTSRAKWGVKRGISLVLLHSNKWTKSNLPLLDCHLSLFNYITSCWPLCEKIHVHRFLAINQLNWTIMCGPGFSHLIHVQKSRVGKAFSYKKTLSVLLCA